ncbi:Outer membrane adhesin like proteiin (fragment) [Hyella patelloides LEGE 07179]|uniref:Outer membrane adhesin like proteiin n=1 Tax=Hyella patelloides LEGE 07179 TaxID=945734 RepID=A0A563W274_9CYAN
MSASLQIQNQPSNGTAIFRPDGQISYVSVPGFAGNDSFTYVVQDNDGQLSNPATVSIAVNNVAPTIEDIQLPDTIIEGTKITIDANVTDPGNDQLTYTWLIDGQSTNTPQPTINRTFIDNGIYNATLTVTDPHGGSDSQTFDITVDNAAPVVDAGTDRTLDEGETITLSGTYSDRGINDTHTLEWEFDDGTIIEAQTAERVYSEPGTYTATFTVTDNDGASSSETITITVNNVAPTITSLTGDSNLNEGDTATFNVEATDPSNGELTYTWDFGDGTPQLSASSDRDPITHTYTDNGNYTVTLTVEDENGASTSQTLDIVVNNVAPAIASIDGATTAEEGETITYTASVSDPGDDELTYNWSVNGSPIEGNSPTIDPTFTDNGTYNLSLTVTDDDGAATTSELEVTVNNVPPLIEIAPTITGNEGEAITFNPTLEDPGNDTLTVTLDFGDSSESVTAYSNGFPVTHTYADNGNYTATLTVTDDDGATTTSTIDVTVNNLAPIITSLTGDTEVNEGETAQFNAVASDSPNDTLTYTLDFGDGSPQLTVNNNGLPVSHEYLDNGNYTITLTVTDDDGASTNQTLDVVVNNVAPVINEIVGDTDVLEGEEVSYTAIASDSGNDTLTYIWDFGDRSTAFGENVTHTFTDNGNYTITLTVSDDDGASTISTIDVTVNNVTPVINEIIGNTDVLEGEEVTYSAIAIDSGNDTLSYNWNFGDGMGAEGQNITHTFADNGNYTITLTVTDDDGASTNSTLDVTVNNVAPTIMEIVGNTNVNEGEEVSYTAIASDSGNDTLTYTWNFGDGSTAEGIDVTHTFIDNGNYTITLTVSDDDGAATNQTLDVTVNNVAPTITEIVGDTDVLEGEEVTYTAIASDNGNDSLTYSWDFGDNNTATGIDVTHTFADNGNYTITLTVTDDDGGTATSTKEVTVNNVAPTITEIIGKQDVNEGEEVTYSASATDPGDDTLTYTWDFGDGNIANGENVTHTFTDNGSYTITLTVSDDDGASTISTIDVTVNNVAPTITEIVGDTDVNEGEEVNYSAIASDSGNDTLTYSWDFGDGNTAEGENVTHTFADNGSYTITLTVTDDDGGTATSTKEVTVNNVAPTITEIVGDTDVLEGEEVNYTAIASDNGNDTLTYNWDFGDGNIANGQDVNHTFADNGNYTITLTVTDDDGASITSTKEVTVNNVAPTITEIVGDTDVNEGEEVTYSASATDPGDDTLTYTWDFGDGTEANGQDVTHTFADNGNYTITLTVTDDDGAATNQTLDVAVNNVAPVINEIIGDTDVNEGEEVTYTAIASDNGNDTLTYTWDFGDGKGANGENVTHTFADNGNYTITLTVTDDDGASITSTKEVTVNNVAPTITEIVGNTEVNEGEETTYSAIASDSGDDTITYSWNFGDGSDSFEGESVNHVFADNGEYTIALTVTDSDGASTTQTLNVTVNNVAPTITEIIGNTNILEGEEVSYSAIASDSGNDTLTYTWNFGDGSTAEGIDVTHTFTNNGSYTISLTVTDDDGAGATSTLNVTVENVAPTITSFTGDNAIDEGDVARFAVIANDPGNDTLTYAWDFGDGSEILSGENVSHLFADNGLYDVSVTVTDDDGASVTQSLTITVNNVTPTTDPWLDKASNEGEIVSFNATFSDPGILDNHTVEWDFGDGSEIITETIASSKQTTYDLQQTHTYTDDGIYTVTLTISDDDGGVATNTMTVTVNNTAPVITSLTGDTDIDEGQIANFSAVATDAGNDTLTYSWDFGSRNTVEGANVTHVFTDNGDYTVTLTVTDDDGAATTSTLEVRVNNVAPTITEISYGEIAEGVSTQFTAMANDPGDDTLTYSWNFGDDSSPVTGKTVNHLFVDNGDYTITLTVTDDDGGVTTSQIAVTATEVFNIKAEGKIRINGRSDFDGEVLNFEDDTRLYAGEGFTINGNQTLPVLRDSAGNPIQVNGKSVLVDRAVTVGPNYTESQASASSRRYANLIPPQVIDELAVNVPEHSELVSSQLTTLIPEGTSEIIFNPQQNPLNNVSDWQNYFPATGTFAQPTVVRITSGNLNIPSNVALSNYVIILDNGSINFNGSGHTLDDTALILNNGSINLASVQSRNLSILASGSINMNGGARFAGDTLIASGNSNGQINFNGATVNNEPSYLTVISQGNITFNGSSTTIGEFLTRKNFTFNGSSHLIGSIQAQGNITINGRATITNFS